MLTYAACESACLPSAGRAAGKEARQRRSSGFRTSRSLNQSRATVLMAAPGELIEPVARAPRVRVGANPRQVPRRPARLSRAPNNDSATSSSILRAVFAFERAWDLVGEPREPRRRCAHSA